MNRRDILKGIGLTSVGVAAPALGLQAAGAPELPLEKFARIKDAGDHDELKWAAGADHKPLDGTAKYWNIKIDKFEALNKHISETHMEDLNQHYAEYFEQRGWQVIDLNVFTPDKDYMGYFIRGVVHMDGEQSWGRRVSEGLKSIKKQSDYPNRKQALMSLYRVYDERWPNGMEWEGFPEGVIIHDYYLGQRFKHNFWEEGQDKFLHI